MSEVTIKWDMNAAGRTVGETEQVELTEFIQGVLYNGYAHTVDSPAPIVGYVAVYPEPSVDTVAETTPVAEALVADTAQ